MPKRNTSTLYSTSTDGDGITSISVNGLTIRPKVENGYAVINRNWRPNDRIDLVLPLVAQRVKASDKVAADAGRVALRYGPLIYSFERVDQNNVNTAVLSPDSQLSTEFKPNLLKGVMVITGKFADGSSMTSIPNYARMNREPTVSSQRMIQPGMGLSGGRGRGGAAMSVIENPAATAVNLGDLLDLTNDQVSKLKNVGSADADSVQKLQQELAAAQTALNNAAVEIDDAKIKAATSQVAAATEKLSLIRAAESRQVKSVLTAEQWKKFQTAMTPAAPQGGGGRGGRGGGPRSIVWIRDSAPSNTGSF